MNASKPIRVVVGIGRCPNDLVYEIVIPKDLVHHYFDVVHCVPVQVDVDTPRRSQQILEQLQSPLQHRKKAVESLSPGISIGQDLDE
jgi:hypothetical protein